MVKIEICDKCRRKAIRYEAVKVYLKYCDPESSENDVWVCEHLLKKSST